MLIAYLIATPTLIVGQITDTSVELAATDIPPGADAVIFRPVEATVADSLRSPELDQPYRGYGALATLGTTTADTLWVTSAADAGTGSLRWHVETMPASDAVVAFDPVTFSGDDTIDLESEIHVRTTDAVIDGFTAGRAVTVRQKRSLDEAVFVFDGLHEPSGSYDTVLRGLRIVQGGTGAVDVDHTADGIHLTGRANKIVIDHCEFVGARDEAIGFAGSHQWITVQWCSFHDVVKTFLISSDWSRTSVHHNFFHGNAERLVLVQGWPTHAGKLELRNNVVHDWRTRGTEWREGAAGNMIGNAYLPGASTIARIRSRALDFDDPRPEVDVRDLVYVHDNILPPGELDAAQARRRDPWPIDPLVIARNHPAVDVPTTSPEEAITDVLSSAGLGPYRSEADLDAARRVLASTTVAGLLEWVPATRPIDTAIVGPNRRVVFDCRAIAGTTFSSFSERIAVWTLASVPAAPLVTIDGQGEVTVVPVRGENPESTALALAHEHGGAVSWYTPSGERRNAPFYARSNLWTGVALENLERGIVHLFRVFARNGALVETSGGPGVRVFWHRDGRPAEIGEVPRAEPRTGLLPSLPNPFRSETLLRYEVDAPAEVTIEIFDVRGRRVRTLRTTETGARRSAMRWNGRDGAGEPVASGVYLYRLTTAGSAHIGHVIRVR